jgi:hypothetical protein
MRLASETRGLVQTPLVIQHDAVDENYGRASMSSPLRFCLQGIRIYEEAEDEQPLRRLHVVGRRLGVDVHAPQAQRRAHDSTDLGCCNRRWA